MLYLKYRWIIAALSCCFTQTFAVDFTLGVSNVLSQRPLITDCEPPIPLTGYQPSQCYTTLESGTSQDVKCQWVADKNVTPGLKPPVTVDNQTYYEHCSPSYQNNVGPEMFMYLDGNDPKQEKACIIEPGIPGHSRQVNVNIAFTSKGAPYQVEHCGGTFQGGQWFGGVTCPTNAYCLAQVLTTDQGKMVRTIHTCVQFGLSSRSKHAANIVKVTHEQFSSAVIQNTPPSNPYALCPETTVTS